MKHLLKCVLNERFSTYALPQCAQKNINPLEWIFSWAASCDLSANDSWHFVQENGLPPWMNEKKPIFYLMKVEKLLLKKNKLCPYWCVFSGGSASVLFAKIDSRTRYKRTVFPLKWLRCSYTKYTTKFTIFRLFYLFTGVNPLVLLQVIWLCEWQLANFTHVRFLAWNEMSRMFNMSHVLR